MAEDLDLDGRAVTDVFDLTGGQFPGEDGPFEAQVGAGFYPVERVDGHLGGGVEGQVGGGLPHRPEDPRVLDENGVSPQFAGPAGQLGSGGQFPVGEEGVESQVDLYPP